MYCASISNETTHNIIGIYSTKELAYKALYKTERNSTLFNLIETIDFKDLTEDDQEYVKSKLTQLYLIHYDGQHIKIGGYQYTIHSIDDINKFTQSNIDNDMWKHHLDYDTREKLDHYFTKEQYDELHVKLNTLDEVRKVTFCLLNNTI